MSLEHSPARERRRPARRLFDDEMLYSAEQVRSKLGGRLHIVTIFRWVKQGRLPRPVKIGSNTTRFLGADLNAHLLDPEHAND